MSNPPEGESAPLCSCGCGQPTKWQAHRGIWARVIWGHKRGPLSAEHKRAISQGHQDAPKRLRSTEPPLCGCGCGNQVGWSTALGRWSEYRAGHATARLPVGTAQVESPPFCLCGCGNATVWNIGGGRWNDFIHGHHTRGKKLTPVHRERQSEAALARSYLARKHSEEVPVAIQNIYGTKAYKEARQRLVVGKPCTRCGRVESICAHHQIPGDNESLVPLCNSCHAQVHRAADGHIQHSPKTVDPSAPNAGVAYAIFGRDPPPGEKAPLCRCGCGQPVGWKRSRGWGKCIRGHATAKYAPVGAKNGPAPLCKCGCGEPCLWKDGKGWAEYRRAHRQRVEGAFNKNSTANLPQFQKHDGDPVKSEMS